MRLNRNILIRRILVNDTSIDNPENYNKRLSNIPLGRFLNPDDIAKTVFFLCSDEAEMITGENFVIDGGSSLV